MTERTASNAIERTLRVVAEGLERDIANYRIGVFAVVALVTGTMRAFGTGDTWIPTLLFAGGTVYAVVFRVLLERFARARVLPLVAVAVDLTISVSPFLVLQAVGSEPQRAANGLFVVYIAAPACMLVLLLNLLRSNALTAAVGAAIAIALFHIVVSRFVGFHPGQVSVTVILLVAGIVGMIAARHAKTTLASFARLELLQRYLPPEAVERVMRENPDEALALGGRLVNVTLLAADLRGFTAMSENLAPNDVMAQLNAYHGTMIEVIDRHGGAIDKFIGDGTLVVFGLQGDEKEAAESAVRCAEAMIAALVHHNDERGRGGAAPLKMGIGVHTGRVVAGNLGVPGRRLEFTVIGDTVNTVSRLEGETKTRGVSVLVSAATATLLANTNQLRELAPVSLRGKNATVSVFALASEGSASG